MARILWWTFLLTFIVTDARAQDSGKAHQLCEKGRKAYLQSTLAGYEEAVRHYEQAVRSDSQSAAALAGLAESYALWGYELEKKGEPAKSYYDRAMRFGMSAVIKDSMSAVAHRALARACMNANPKELGGTAYASLDRARQIDSTDAEVFYLLWMLTDNEDPDSPYALKSLALNRDYFPSHYGLGLLCARRKEFDKAIAHYKEAVRINGRHPLPYYSLGHAYSQQKKYDLAIPEYEKALDLDESLSDAHFFLGLACYYEHEDKKAAKNFTRYLELVPESTYRRQVEDMLQQLK